MPDSCVGHTKLYIDPEGAKLLLRTTELQVDMEAIAAEFNALIEQAAKYWCPVVRVPSNAVLECKGDER